ncbi:MAG: membrane protein insertase YidC [Betaproteobacteria bacterium]|nr:membrane protein insertase YidC [Betaproteobacteria bacterium]
MDTQRLILLFVFSFSLLLLWDAWEREKRPKPPPVQAQPGAAVPAPAAPAQSPAPAAPAAGAAPGPPAAAPAAVAPQGATDTKGETVQVRTDLLLAEIDTLGGTLKRVELIAHRDGTDPKKNYTLLGPEFAYEAQSGVAGEGGPNHRSLWRLQPGARSLEPGSKSLELRLSAEGRDGLAVDKVYRFSRDSYLVEVALELRNTGAAPLSPFGYFQLTHNGKSPAGGSSIAQSFGAQSFFGFSVYTEEKKFQKVALSDIDSGKPDHVRQAKDGWLAFVQHYFVAGWLPVAGAPRDYVMEKRQDGTYAGRLLMPAPAIAPGGSAQLVAPLYVGPQEQRRLQAAATGFELVVDYGWLTIIAWPLFAVLEFFHQLTGNWGVAIILLTVTIKLLFFPLSAASYKSMAKMKLITPRLTKIREMYEHDRNKMNQAMMELYRTEKINPLGGCFPILVQIPVFIALYWVLLAAIELRHAPFMLWIQDLSALDPYYVLPVLMTITMVIQTKLNPVPPDPVQAKVMLFMPYVFSVFFFFFPAGLVLYWLINNILSILQQWQIQRMFERDKPAHAKR